MLKSLVDLSNLRDKSRRKGSEKMNRLQAGLEKVAITGTVNSNQDTKYEKKKK